MEKKENNEINASVRQYLAEIGGRGGKAEVAKGFSKLKPQERKANAKRAAEARWGKAKKGEAKGK